MSCVLLLIPGSLRQRSTNLAVLRTAQRDVQAEVRAELYEELATLPHFNPDDEASGLPTAVARLRAAVHRADALLFSTPEYAGAMPGALKNLLEWLIGDAQPRSLADKPVGWINASPRGATLTYDSLRTVLRYGQARIIPDACGSVPVTSSSLSEDGLLADRLARDEVRRIARALAAATCPGTSRAESF